MGSGFHNLGVQVRGTQFGLRSHDFIRSRAALQREDDSVRRTERAAPADQAVEGREGSGDDDVISLMMVFGAGSDHLDVGADAQLFDGLGQEGAPSKQGLISVSCRSGRSRASGMPGRPAPLPTSATVRSATMSSFKAAQLRMCRSHRRSASRGAEQAPLHSRRLQDVDISI